VWDGSYSATRFTIGCDLRYELDEKMEGGVGHC
jgi:hypothetical protein